MYALRDKYAIAGIGWTEFSKKSGRTVRSLASEASLKAIEDAGLKVADIDGFVSFNFNDSVPAIAVATEIGVPAARYANDFLSGGNAANMIVLTAAAVIEAGFAETVLCYRAMNGRSGFRLGGGRDLSAYGITQFTAPFGWITYPQAMAMWCRRHMIEYGTTAEQLGEIAVTFRTNAVTNPRAMQRDPISMDDYMASRMIVEPFRMLDICLETDGACAVLVTSAERARDLRSKPSIFLVAPMAADRTRARICLTRYAGPIIRTITRNTSPTISGAAPAWVLRTSMSPKSTTASLIASSCSSKASDSARKEKAVRSCKADASRAMARCRSTPTAACCPKPISTASIT